MFKPDPLKNICRALEMDDLSEDPRFTTLADQLAHRDELWVHLERGFKEFTTEECVRRLDAQDILCAPTLDYDAFPQHPQAVENGIFRTVEHPTLGSITLVETPLRLSEAPASARPFVAPPQLGQHSEDVLSELGFGPEVLERLREGGVT
jgi:formyl-CoA transferase